jgi:hypothetical protein
MTLKQIEKKWLANFRRSPLVSNGVFNSDLAWKLFKGFGDDPYAPFKKGFAEFKYSFNHSDQAKGLDELLKYLHFIGITIKK